MNNLDINEDDDPFYDNLAKQICEEQDREIARVLGIDEKDVSEFWEKFIANLRRKI